MTTSLEYSRAQSGSRTGLHDNVIDDENKSHIITHRLTVNATLTLRVPTDFKRLATLDFVHARALARVAGKFQDDLLRGLRFFCETLAWFDPRSQIVFCHNGVYL